MKPELGQRREKDGEIPSAVGGKKSGYVLNEQPSSIGENSVSDSGELEEETGSLSAESCSSAGDGEILARESAAEEVNSIGTWVCPPGPVSAGVTFSCPTADPWRVGLNISNVLVAANSGPMPSEDGSSVGVAFALEDDLVSRSFEAKVKPTDP